MCLALQLLTQHQGDKGGQAQEGSEGEAVLLEGQAPQAFNLQLRGSLLLSISVLDKNSFFFWCLFFLFFLYLNIFRFLLLENSTLFMLALLYLPLQ